MRATCSDNLEIAKILIEAGADINAIDNQKKSVLTHAVINKNIPLIKMLIANKVDQNVKR